MWSVKHNITCIVCANEPTPAMCSREICGTLTQEAGSQHVVVERTLGLLLRHAGRTGLAREVFLDLCPELLACESELAKSYS